MFTRREFLRALGYVAGAIATYGPAGAAAFAPRGPGDWSGRRVLADLHTHPSLNDWLATAPLARSDPGLLKVARRQFNPTKAKWRDLHRSGIDLVCAAHFNMFDEWLSMPTDPDRHAPDHTLAMLDRLEEILAGAEGRFARVAHNRMELDAILSRRFPDADYRVAVVHALEGGHALGGSVDCIPQLARKGVAIITLTHFFQKGIASSPNAFPFFADADADWAPTGLSPFGRDVIRAMEEHGVIVDVTHATDHALSDILSFVRRPVVATHSGSRTLSDHPYGIHDEHAREIASKGGLIGIILYPYLLSNYIDEEEAVSRGSLRDFVRTIEYLIELLGSHRSLAVGSDFSGFIRGPRDLSDLGHVALVREALQANLKDDVVEDVIAGNAIRFLQEHWGATS